MIPLLLVREIEREREDGEEDSEGGEREKERDKYLTPSTTGILEH